MTRIQRPHRAEIDPELFAIQSALSHVDTSPSAWSRRRFLTAAAAAGGLATLDLGGLFDSIAAGATPLAPTERVLVMVTLAGGNDGLNTVVPIDDPLYFQNRGSLAIQPAAGLRIADGVALHPSLPRLKARYDAGRVAVVRGVGQVGDDLSHFSSMATMMVGGSGSATGPSSGWLGRFLDGLPDANTGLRGATVSSAVPLHLLGQRSTATALSTSGDLFGTGTDEAWEIATYQPVRSFASAPTGRGGLADALAIAGRGALDTAGLIGPAYATALPDDEATADMILVGRLINADLGLRVLSVTLGSFDTHDNQTYDHAQMLDRLDRGIESLFATLEPRLADRVVVATFSEFGRRVQRNDAGGTDHGTASSWFVVGNAIQGGLYGTQPSLSTLDSRGDMRVGMDFRSVYATLLDGVLGGDADAILGSHFERLPLVRSAAPSPTTAPPNTAPPTTSSPTTSPPTTTTSPPSTTPATPPAPAPLPVPPLPAPVPLLQPPPTPPAPLPMPLPAPEVTYVTRKRVVIRNGGRVTITERIPVTTPARPGAPARRRSARRHHR